MFTAYDSRQSKAESMAAVIGLLNIYEYGVLLIPHCNIPI